MKKNRAPLISIVISNFNGEKLHTLSECLKSFKKIDYPNYELLLVDNASTDDSVAAAKKIFGRDKRYKILRNSVNLYSLGVNMGFREAKGEYIALFNNDIEVEKGYLQKLVSELKRNPKLAVVQGKFLWYFDHSIIDSAGETMDVYGNPVTLGYRTKDVGLFDKKEEILSASGAGCLIKTSALREVGEYDSKYGIGYEDMDLSLRLRQKGYAIMCVPDAVCFHKRGTTDLSDEVRVKVRWHFNKNRIATMVRNYPLGLLVKALPVTILIYLGNMIWEMVALRNTPLALTRVQSILWTIQNFPYLLRERNKIRRGATKRSDRKMLILFSNSDIKGKMLAVIMDRLSPFLLKLQYTFSWTYPAQIKNLIPKGSTILDVGCGDGHLMAWINSKGDYKVVGIDINEQDLDVAKARKCLLANDRFVFEKLVKADITKKLLLKSKFDVVLCSQTVEHLKKEKAIELISNIENLAKKRIIVATINGFFQYDHRKPEKYDLHLSGWSPEDFRNLNYRVYGHSLKFIYRPGGLKDKFPYLNAIFFVISYIATPLLHYIHRPALLLISYKDVRKK